MLAARNGLTDARRWMLSGGSETLDSYNGPDGRVAQLCDVEKNHWTFLVERLLPYWESENFVFVHASVQPQLPMSEQTDTYLYWTGFSSLAEKHCSGKAVVCGHEMQESGVPVCNTRGVCIDTGAWNGGWLTCIDPELGRIWQANEQGDTRQSTLPWIK
jgi:serine/threonine protein phosphatase 1